MNEHVSTESPLVTPSALVVIEELTKVYGSGEIAVRALRGIDLQIARGEFVAVMGPSGSGKSTLMNILGALDHPTSGHYWLDGEDIASFDKAHLARIRNAKIGFVFQSFNLLPRTAALEQVMMPMLYSPQHGTQPLEEHRSRAATALQMVGLADRAGHLPSELSGGQQQRVAIARALVLDPPMILADEPTGNLDTRTAQEIMDLLTQLNDDGTTIIMVTHGPETSQRAKRVVCVRDGLVISDGPSERSTCMERSA